MPQNRFKQCLSSILLVLCLPFWAQAEKPNVNEAVVIIDNEAIVMQAVSMKTQSDAVYHRTQHISENTPATSNVRMAYMEAIVFIQTDKKTGHILKQLELCLPGNWEPGITYSSTKEDGVFGTPVIRLWDYATNHIYDTSYRVGECMTALLIDQADPDFSTLEGRFMGKITSEVDTSAPKTIALDFSSFNIDKAYLPNPEPTLVFPVIPTPTPRPTAVPIIIPAPQSKVCFACRGNGVCTVCNGRRRYYISGYAGSSGSYIDCSGCDASGKCSICDGTGRE